MKIKRLRLGFWLRKSFIKIFSKINGGNYNSAIMLVNQSNSVLSTSHPISILVTFQFLDWRNVFEPIWINNTSHSTDNLLPNFLVRYSIKLFFVFICEKNFHKPIFCSTLLVSARPLFFPSSISLIILASSTSSMIDSVFFSANNRSMAKMLLPSLLFSLMFNVKFMSQR